MSHLEPHGLHFKMILTGHRKVLEPRSAPVPIGALSTPDLPAILEFYRQSYAGNWFDARMLETGQYCGAFAGNELVAIAGVHVYSERYRVAALGNVATHPLHRGKGLGTAVTAALCRSLLSRVDKIGLNVKADNLAALRCYEKLGFEKRAAYHETMVVR
jgi:ribosomal protein S18 acetylase RimI-like enzyme